MSTPHHDDSVADSIADALDPLEVHQQSDPRTPVPLVTQIVRFTVTGVLAAVVDYGLLQTLIHLAGWDPTLAKCASFVAGTFTAYMINRRWTFRAEPSTARFVAVMALYGVMFAVQVGLFSLIYPHLTEPWGEFWAYTAAFVVAQGVATVTNFVVQRTVIFRLS